MKAATIIKDGLQLGIFETYYSEQATHTISLSLRVIDPINIRVFFGFLFFRTNQFFSHFFIRYGKSFHICLQKSNIIA